MTIQTKPGVRLVERQPILWLIGLSISLAWGSISHAGKLRPLVLINGQIDEVQLRSISEGKIWFLDSESTAKSVELQQVVRWGSLSEREQTEQVALIDGSILVGKVTAISRSQLTMATDVWGELTLPVAQVSHVVWKYPTDLDRRRQFRDALRLAPQTFPNDSPKLPRRNQIRGKFQERLRLSNGDILAGRLVSAGAQAIDFETKNGEIELQPKLISAWTREDSVVARGHVIGFRDGTRLVAQSVRIDEQIEVELDCGQRLGSLPEVRPISEGLVCYIRPRHPSMRYLSDIEPLGHKHIPLLTTTWSWGRDRNVLQGPITSHTRSFEKGIGMHSTSRLAFDLPEGFDEFQSEISIDRSAEKEGSVVFRVFTSSEGTDWTVAYKSDVIRGGDTPAPVRVDIRGARRLALVVDFAERGDLLDRANWIGARIVHRQP